MEKEFEAGKSYTWADRSYDPFTVLKRTEKTITVTNGCNTWRMMIRHDEKGEFVHDSTMGKNNYDLFTSRPSYLVP